MIDTIVNIPISEEIVSNYFERLVNSFFKILPIRESGETTLPIYIQSLQIEVLGCKQFIKILNNDSSIIALVSILQYVYDNPECPVADVKREVFKAISICNKLKDKLPKVNSKN